MREIPQSVTVVTERLIDERNLDTVKESLKSTSGISFQATDGGEEDIKLRGFSLAGIGDIFVDSMRDPAFYERDTFRLDRLEVMRGSASMLFGRGSTGGFNRIPIVSWLKANATESLDHAHKAGELDTLIGGHPSLKSGSLLETEQHEQTALTANYDLLRIVESGFSATRRVRTRDDCAGRTSPRRSQQDAAPPWGDCAV